MSLMISANYVSITLHFRL